jgi:hypothetical protein
MLVSIKPFTGEKKKKKKKKGKERKGKEKKVRREMAVAIW